MNVLEEAAGLINGDRAKDYGDASENFERIAKLWGAYRGQFFDRHDVSMMMILVKVARQSNGYHRDSAVDIAGYTALGEQVHDELESRFDLYVDRLKSNQPRVWMSLTDVPEDLPVLGIDDKPGDEPWLGEGPDGDTYYDRHGPFTEVLETDA